MKPLLLFLLLFLYGCAVKTWDVVGQSELSNGLRVSIRTNAWEYSPSNLENYVLPIYLEVENLSDVPLFLRREDVYIVDNKGNQYNSLEPKDVAGILRDYSSIGFSFSIGYWSSPIGIWWWPYYTIPYGERTYPDIINKAFTFGQIRPKNKISGFIYFPKMPKEVESITLYVKEYKFQLRSKQN